MGTHIHPFHRPDYPPGRTGPQRGRLLHHRYGAGYRPFQLDEIHRPFPERLGASARLHPGAREGAHRLRALYGSAAGRCLIGHPVVQSGYLDAQGRPQGTPRI